MREIEISYSTKDTIIFFAEEPQKDLQIKVSRCVFQSAELPPRLNVATARAPSKEEDEERHSRHITTQHNATHHITTQHPRHTLSWNDL